jgi:hypothetical protein
LQEVTDFSVFAKDAECSFAALADPDLNWTRIRIGIQPKMLDPDPYQMNTDRNPGGMYLNVKFFLHIWRIN